MTAGRIAKHFIDLTRNMTKSVEREALKNLAGEFSDLVTLRNAILHGKPCTGPTGEARLSGAGIFEVPDLEDAADQFAECANKLNGLFYGFLTSYAPL